MALQSGPGKKSIAGGIGQDSVTVVMGCAAR
jgi:hypothetical protein